MAEESMLDQLLSKLREGNVTKEEKKFMAMGAIPWEDLILVRILFYLAFDPDEETASTARETIRDMPSGAFANTVEDENVPPDFLDFIVRERIQDNELLRKIIIHPNTPDETLMYIAENALPETLEILCLNQTRLLNYPPLIDMLLINPQCPTSSKIRLNEIKNDFAGRIRKRLKELNILGDEDEISMDEAPEWEEEPEDFPGEEKLEAKGRVKSEPEIETDDLEFEEEFDYEEEYDEYDEYGEYDERKEYDEYDEYDDFDDEELLAFMDEEEKKAEDEESLELRQQLKKLSPADKRLRAKVGTKQERYILVRDSDKRVAVEAVNSPKATEFEIEQVAKLRSVSEEVLREIAVHREWSKHYGIVSALVKNPKTPTGISLRMIKRLTDIDLNSIVKDKEVPYGVRAQSKRLLEVREMRKR